MLLFKHMPYDEAHKAAIKNIAYTVVQQAAWPVQATTASQTVNHQVIPKVIFPLKISAIKLRLLPWATIISYQAIPSSLCYSEWEMCLAFTTRKNRLDLWSESPEVHTERIERQGKRSCSWESSSFVLLYSRFCFIGLCFILVLNSWSKRTAEHKLVING